MTSFLSSAHSFHRKWGFSVTFLFLNQLSSNLAQGFKIGRWFLFLAQKVVLGTISDNMTQKPLFYACVLAKRFLEIALSWQHLRSQVIKNYLKGCYTLQLKVTKFQLPTPNAFWAVLKKQLRGKICPSPSKIGLIFLNKLKFTRSFKSCSKNPIKSKMVDLLPW